MLKIGSLVDGKYKILSEIGHGGMSVVYMAINEKANKTWAVKEVRKDGVLDFEAVKQGLVAETDILKKLDHPSLPSIIDVIDTEDSFIIIMDYIQGNSLNKTLEEYGAQPQENVIEWAKQLCDVLGYLHSRTPPIIYRDMKPANIMLKPDGNVTLIDFGTAREFKEKNLADTTCLGTVGYAAPEQFGGMGQTDGRTDIYCLGATLYHLVTGMNPCEPPYEIKPIREINPSLSSGLERIILKCTQRDPNDRYQSAAELMYALEHYEEIDDVYRKKQRKKLWTFLVPTILSAAFAGVAVWGYLSAEKKKKDNYDYLVNTASSYEEYRQAILTDPTRTEAYLGDRGLIEFLTNDEDGLSIMDHTRFNEIRSGINTESSTVYVMDALKRADPKGYSEVCYEIGYAFLYRYEIESDSKRYSYACEWFEDSKEDHVDAYAYCQISNCLKSISKYQEAKQGMQMEEEYKKLWSQMEQLSNDMIGLEDTSEGRDIKVRAWGEIVRIIRNNVRELCDAVSKQEVEGLVDTIEENAAKIPNNSFIKDNLEQLSTLIAGARDKLNGIID